MSHSNILDSVVVAIRVVGELLFVLHPSERSVLGWNLHLVRELRERGYGCLKHGASEENK